MASLVHQEIFDRCPQTLHLTNSSAESASGTIRRPIDWCGNSNLSSAVYSALVFGRILAHREFDSMDICQSVMANFFVRAAAGQFDLKVPDDLIKLLVTMTRNKVAEKMRRQHRQRRDSRRTEGGVEELALAGQDPSPSSLVAGKELLEEVRQRLGEDDRQLVELRSQGLSWEEIADCLGGTAGARRNQLARALDRVAAELRLDEMTE